MTDWRGIIHGWHRDELQSPRPGHAPGTRIVMGMPIWGEPYTYDWSIYGLPSIVARQNRMALGAAGCSIVLYTDDKTRDRLSPRCKALHAPVQFRELPREIWECMRELPTTKYPLLAAVHNLLIHEAAEIGAGFHMLVADCLYSSGYFANLLRLAEHHQAIPHMGFAISRHDARGKLEHYRQDNGSLRITARDLGQIAWDHAIRPWNTWELPEDFTAMPGCHFVFQRGQDHIDIHSPHETAAWIGPERCKQAGRDLGGTIDSELPRYLGRDFYGTTLSDEMTFAVLADHCPPSETQSFESFKQEMTASLWGGPSHPYYNDFANYFRTPCPLPLRTIDLDRPTDDQLRERMDRLMARLLA